MEQEEGKEKKEGGDWPSWDHTAHIPFHLWFPLFSMQSRHSPVFLTVPHLLSYVIQNHIWSCNSPCLLRSVSSPLCPQIHCLCVRPDWPCYSWPEEAELITHARQQGWQACKLWPCWPASLLVVYSLPPFSLCFAHFLVWWLGCPECQRASSLRWCLALLFICSFWFCDGANIGLLTAGFLELSWRGVQAFAFC